MYLAKLHEVLTFVNKTKQIYKLRIYYNKAKNIRKKAKYDLVFVQTYSNGTYLQN